MKRLDKLFVELGYCRRRTVRDFFKKNEVEVVGKDIRKMRRNALVDWRSVRVNGQPLEFVHTLNIMINKPQYMRSNDAEDYRDAQTVDYFTESEVYENDNDNDNVFDKEYGTTAAATADGNDENVDFEEEEELDDGELFDVLPPLFVFRSPKIKIFSPLPDSVSGLTFMTQDDALLKKLNSVRTPLKRVYEVQVRQSYTGLENEALQMFRSGIKGSVKSFIPQPRFNIVDEQNRIAHIVLYDYRPDNIFDMLIAMRHEPERITRIGLGNLLLATDTTLDLHERIKQSGGDNAGLDKRLLRLGDADWMELDEERLSILTKPQQDIVDRRFQAKIERRKVHGDKRVIHVSSVVKNISRAENINLDEVHLTGHFGKPKEYAKFVATFSKALASEIESYQDEQPSENHSQFNRESYASSKSKMDSIFDGDDGYTEFDEDNDYDDDYDDEDYIVDSSKRSGRQQQGNGRRKLMKHDEINLSQVGNKIRTITEIQTKDKKRKAK